MRRMIPTLLLALTIGLIVPVPPAGAVEFPTDIDCDSCDARWRDQVVGPPGSCEGTICTVGAYLTRWAVLLSWQAGQADAPDPGQLNAWRPAIACPRCACPGGRGTAAPPPSGNA